MKRFLVALIAVTLIIGIPIVIYLVGQTVATSPFETRTITILRK